MRKIWGALALTMVALTLACGAGVSESTNETGDSKGTNVGAEAGYDAIKDVKLTACKAPGPDDFGMATVTATITNNGKNMASYFVTVAFEDADKNQLGTTMLAAENLAPGQKGKAEAPSLEDLSDKKFTCRVVGVDRWEA